MQHISVPDLPPELLGQIAERLSPTDLLRMSQTHQQMSNAITEIATLQARRERAAQAGRGEEAR
ncbi:F-box protein [Mesorhizobium sangaii]|uniref:F-box protein n=1 Tax=Mesorhizobium sangaii TaxID=505389 RepID=UPI0016203F43